MFQFASCTVDTGSSVSYSLRTNVQQLSLLYNRERLYYKVLCCPPLCCGGRRRPRIVLLDYGGFSRLDRPPRLPKASNNKEPAKPVEPRIFADSAGAYTSPLVLFELANVRLWIRGDSIVLKGQYSFCP